MTRRSYKGNAAGTTLSAGINASVTSIGVTDGSTYPDGSAGPFFVVIDKGLVGEEKILVTTRVGNTFTVVTRGQDDTSASSHSAGATVYHCFTKTDADEANSHVNSTGAVHTGASLSPATLILPAATVPAETAEGSAVWDSDDDLLTVGTGAGRKTMVDTNSTQTLTGKTLTDPTLNAAGGTLVLPQGTVPAQVAEGQVVWDTDDDVLTVGTAAARKTMVDTNSTQTLSGKTLTNPTVNAAGGVLVLPQAASPAETAEGQVVWDTDDDLLTVGTSSGRKTMVDLDSAQSLSSKTLDAASTLGGVSGTTLAAERAAWTAYTPTVTNLTSSKTINGRYVQVGKTVRVQIVLQITATPTGSGSWLIQLPVTANTTLNTGNGVDLGTVRYRTNGGSHVLGVVDLNTSTTVTVMAPQPGGGSPNMLRATSASPTGQANGDEWHLEFEYEAA